MANLEQDIEAKYPRMRLASFQGYNHVRPGLLGPLVVYRASLLIIGDPGTFSWTTLKGHAKMGKV